MILKWHVIIGGFRQNEGVQTGQIALWEMLERTIGKHDATRVEYRDWLDDMSQLAGLIRNQSPPRHQGEMPTTVNVYAFSWGGPTAVRLAEQLADAGIRVHEMVLADPVYRHRYVWGWWRAMVPVAVRPYVSWLFPSTLRVPRNVDTVTQIYQRESLPSAHDVVATSRQTVVRPRVQVFVPHGLVDYTEEYHEAAERAAAELQYQ